MFKNIDKIKLGDKVIIENFKETIVYEASEIRIIEPDAINEITIKENCDLLTLMSCHPYPTNEQRYIVICTRKKL